MNEMIPIGQAARILGVSVDTVRAWEAAGKITSRRLPSGHRRFNRADIEALANGDAA